MGASDNMASAPEEGRKCWMKVSLDNKSRMIEWNTQWSTFKEMDTKVRRMFGLNDKVKLSYTYQEGSTQSYIVMSSDEELGTALSLMTGSILLVEAVVERKRQKSAMCRFMRAAKAQQPVVTDFLSNLQTTVLAHARAVPLSAIVERMRACGQSAAACASERFRCRRNANANANPHVVPAAPCLRLRKVWIGLLVLLLAVMVAHTKCSHHRRGEWVNYYHQVHHQHHQFPPQHPYHHQHQQQHGKPTNHITILAATYGGVDVTRRLQEFYNNNGAVMPSNAVFGDPAVNVKKYLHVVYQHIGKNGIAEVFSQSFLESDQSAAFSMTRDSCAFPEEAIVDGRSVKVLGALYDDVAATCAARRLAATGRFTATKTHRDNYIHRNHFGSVSGTGVYTMVYLKDNTLQMITAREGNVVAF